MTKNQIKALLATLPMGRNQPVFGQSVMRTPKGYKIGDSPNLFTLEDALAKMEESAAQQPAKVIAPCYPKSLRALTIKNGFCWEIIEGYKSEEYRSYQLSDPGWLIIHTSSQDGTGIYQQYGIPEARRLPNSSIVGAMKISYCIWDEDCWAWVISDVVKLDQPHREISGEIKPWIPRESKTDFQKKVRAFNAVWEAIQAYEKS